VLRQVELEAKSATIWSEKVVLIRNTRQKTYEMGILKVHKHGAFIIVIYNKVIIT